MRHDDVGARGRGFAQEELATVAGLPVRAVSALERGERRRTYD
jgi:transcriptional regulator with XRE-family HTH domain